MFHKNKYIRTISLNSHYMVLFKNPRDVSQFAGTGRRSTSAINHISRRQTLRVCSTMSEHVKKYLPVLERIRRLGDRAKKEYIRKCDREFVDCVSECAKNVIKRERSSHGPSDDQLAS